MGAANAAAPCTERCALDTQHSTAPVELREAWARWLRSLRWSYVATPTFRRPVSEAAARRAVAQWLAPLGKSVYAAVAVERGRVEGRVHAHVLLGGLARREGVDVALRLGWGTRGRITIAPYHGRGGAARYLCKDGPDAVELLGDVRPYRHSVAHGGRGCMPEGRRVRGMEP